VSADDVNFKSAMRTLTNYCFLEVQTALKSWSMHTCVHDWTVAALNKAIDAQRYWYAFDCIAASISKDDQNSYGHLFYARLSTHATQLVQDRFCRDDLINDIMPDRLEKAFHIAALLREQVQLAAAEQMYLLVLAGYEKALGAEHTLTLSTVNNLGILYRARGKLAEAEMMYLRALVYLPPHPQRLPQVSVQL
jgi:tetratricopeptide (TPR) repeat protein